MTRVGGSLEEWHVNGVLVVDVVSGRLDAGIAGSEDAVPNARLLAVVVTLSPALTVVQVVILDDDFHVQALEQPGKGRGNG